MADKKDKSKDNSKPKAPQQYFWEKWLSKRKVKKQRRADTAIPAPPMSREDRLKLLVVLGIIVIVLPALIYLGLHTGGPPPEKPATNSATK